MNSDNIVDNVVLKCSARLSQPDLQFVKNVLVGELSKYKITSLLTTTNLMKLRERSINSLNSLETIARMLLGLTQH